MSRLAEIHTLSDIDLLRESVDLECKLALGQDGQGKLPKDFWPTYSAMANTEGGLILLGVQEKKGRFQARNLPNPNAIRKELADLLGNRQKVSVNLLSDDHIHELDIEGCLILAIEVPRALRKQRPVFINGNPLGGTYRGRSRARNSRSTTSRPCANSARSAECSARFSPKRKTKSRTPPSLRG